MIDVKVGKFSYIESLAKNNKTIYVSDDKPAIWFGQHRVPIWAESDGESVINEIINNKDFTNVEDVENLILEKNYITMDDVNTIEGPQGAVGAQGAQGAQGAEGKRGQDGRTYYTWIKYADTVQGDGLSDSPLENGIFKEYIGFAYNKLTPEESNDPIDYVWHKFKGTDGTNGVGIKGDDGITYYTWIKYANKYPTSNSDMYDVPNEYTEYIGISVNNTSETEGWDYTLYTWSKFKGDKGAQGAAGKDGTTINYYTWIMYADDIEGNGMSNAPYENGVRKMYIGFAYNQTVPTESNDPSDYTWYQFAGTDGKDGVAYAIDGKTFYMWIKYSDNYPTQDSDIYDEPHEGTEWIGIAANQEDEHESSNWTLYSWSKFKGDQGVQGASGVTYYTWIKYADDANGNGLSNSPINEDGTFKEYIGFAYGKLTPEESENPSEYIWSLFKGTNGKDGIGVKGADGKTYYTWIKYSDVFPTSPDDLYDEPRSTTEWIGISVNNEEQAESDDFNDYQWSKFKGDQGVPGAQGAPGTNGVTLYTWIMYADDEQGNGMTNTPYENGVRKMYIGFAYKRTSPVESTDPTDYTWFQFAGTDGKDGVAYAVDGKTFYMWIKYADKYPTQDSDIYDTPHEGTEYIGIATNKEEQTESSHWTEYVWSKFKGDQGVAGTDGKDGITLYTWIKYADDENGNGLSDSPIGEDGTFKTYIGFAYDKLTPEESTNPTDYMWSLFKGTDGEKGIPGDKGADGKTQYTWIKYSDNYPSKNEDLYDIPTENTEWIGIAVNKEEELEAWDWTLYTWSKFKGDQGVPGERGAKGEDGITFYTWIRYADDEYGTGINDSPFDSEGNRKLYIGFAYGKTTPEESNNPKDYTWSRFAGTDGEDGIGIKGADGITYYTWIKYSDTFPTAQTVIYDTPKDTTEWIGIAVNKTEQHESWDFAEYEWSKFKGDDGVAGIDGITYYTWIKYADDAEGNGMTNEPFIADVRKEYIGFAYNKITADESNDPKDYVWTKFVGADGERGIPGEVGADGKTYYTWIKYSTKFPTKNNDLYDTPTEETEWIGIATNKEEEIESWDWTLYSWSKFKGDQGVPGEKGEKGDKGDKGADGATKYTWIKYADDVQGNGMSDSPIENGIFKKFIGFAYDKDVQTESNDPTDYTWAKFGGEDGINGTDGIAVDGKDGKTYYTWIKYSNKYPTSNDDLYDVPTIDTEYIGISVNNEEQEESWNWTAYVWSKFKGDQGVPGKNAEPLYTWIKYADDINGNGISNTPYDEEGKMKLYIGFAYNKTTVEESDNPADYTWSQFAAVSDDQGIGYPGQDGKTYYMWLKYADQKPSDENPTIYDEPTDATEYIGIAVNQLVAQESTDWQKYTWSKFKGDKGVQGDAGITYYTWIRYADDDHGTGISDQPFVNGVRKMYIGFAYRKETPIESDNWQDYTWSRFAGTDGQDGIGVKGEDGITYYTWIKYADVMPTTGTDMYDEPTETTEYIGISVNNASKHESNDPGDYAWTKFKGDQGPIGITGAKGDKGDTTYTWVKYADDEHGTNMTNDPFGDGSRKLYIGFAYNQTTPIESQDPNDYAWTRWAGTDGKDGIGVPGADGKTYYTWIKYSDNYPTSNADIYDSPTEFTRYMGISVNNEEQEESDDWRAYSWELIKGADGIPGKDGKDAIQYYTWIRYANNRYGDGMSDSPVNEDGTFKEYIGFAYNKTTPEESNNAGDYQWSLFKGTNGTDGIDGAKGENGETYYTWIKYATVYPTMDEHIYDTPTELTEWIGIAVNKLIETESNDYREYTWSKFKGDQGVRGERGDKGERGDAGKTYYTWIKYANAADGTGLDDSPLNNDGTFKKYIGFAFNKETPVESNVAEDYTWSKFAGEDGINGQDGIGIDGEDGKTYYMWIKYSDTYPTKNSDIYDEPREGTEWIGISYNNIEQHESEDWTVYDWSHFKGDQGVAGTNGKDGVTTYTWIKYANDEIGTGMSNSPLNDDGTFKTYIGFAYSKFSPEESDNYLDYKWTLFKGTDGTNGIDGEKGADGKTYYTWIKYADVYPENELTIIYDSPKSTTEWIGIAVNQEVQAESSNYSKYTWSKFKGDQGVKGDKGDAGKDGTSFNMQGTVINWMTNTNAYPIGSGELWAIDSPHGLYWQDANEEPHHVVPSNGDAYILSRPGDILDGHLLMSDGTRWVDCGAIKGPQGAQGEAGKDGAKGADGDIKYTWIKYADDREGNGISNSPLNQDGTYKKYIGFAYNKPTPQESDNPADYEWTLFAGANGKDGIDGQKGADGKTHYTWIKYADSIPHSNDDIYDEPKETTQYIGIATNKEVQEESNVFTDYVWSKFKGDDGKDGTDGVAKYTWIKYADTDTGEGLSDSPFALMTPRTEMTREELIQRFAEFETIPESAASAYFR